MKVKRFAWLPVAVLSLAACAHTSAAVDVQPATAADGQPANDGFPSASATAPKSPLLVVDAQSVSLDGVKVCDASAIANPKADGTALIQAFKDHPFFTPDIEFEAKPGASTRAAARALLVAAAAKHTKVHFVGTNVVATHRPVPLTPVDTLLRVALESDGARLTWATDVPCDKAPHGGPVGRDEIAASVARGCGAEPCIDEAWIRASDDMPFARIVDAIGAASKEGTPEFAFSIAVPAEETVERRDVCGERIVLLLHQEEIQRIVRADFGAVRACYVDALKRDPKAGGRIGIRFMVESDGHVDQVSAENDSAFRDPAATSCILARFRKLQFPKRTFGGTTTVVYPIIFDADDSPAKLAP